MFYGVSEDALVKMLESAIALLQCWGKPECKFQCINLKVFFKDIIQGVIWIDGDSDEIRDRS